jgi:hypothetical protein
MGDLWRSQEMQLVQLFVQIEAAHDTVDELGELGLIQFRDVRLYFCSGIFYTAPLSCFSAIGKLCFFFSNKKALFEHKMDSPCFPFYS